MLIDVAFHRLHDVRVSRVRVLVLFAGAQTERADFREEGVEPPGILHHGIQHALQAVQESFLRFGLSAHAEVVDQAVQIVSEETQHMVGTHAALQAFFIEFLQYGLHALRIARGNVVAQAGFAVHGVFKIVQGVVLV